MVFVKLTGHFPAISDDLVNSYHLLLCCLDWIYYNTLISDRRDLLNHSFSGYFINFCTFYKQMLHSNSASTLFHFFIQDVNM